MVNELIAKLPETVIQAIRARTFTARPEVDLTDIRLLSRQLSQAFAEGDDIMPLMPAYARLIDELIERPASCWSADTREIHDALKRRCLYHWVDYPSAERELQILTTKLPHIGAQLSAQVVAFVQGLRKQDLFKLPGVAETLDWADALTQLDKIALDGDAIDSTLGALLKYQDDIAKIRGSEAAKLLEQVKSEVIQLEASNG